jgi:hypothetical protein
VQTGKSEIQGKEFHAIDHNGKWKALQAESSELAVNSKYGRNVEHSRALLVIPL